MAALTCLYEWLLVCHILHLLFYLCTAGLAFFQYVHYEVDYSDVELNKEEKGKEKKKDEKV